MFSSFSQGHYNVVYDKLLCPESEIELSIIFSKIITITLNVPPIFTLLNFFSEVQLFEFRVFLLLPNKGESIKTSLIFTHSRCINAFSKDMSEKLNVDILVQDMNLGCLNFWNDSCWFLSLRVFGLLSSSLLLFPQCFRTHGEMVICATVP